MKTEKLIDIAYKIIPYVIILIASLLGLYLVFYPGLINGHDFRFHVPNVLEQYQTIIKTGSISEISSYVAMGLGTGTRLYYCPLAHFFITTFALMFNDIYVAFKVTLVLSVFVSGVFMYLMMMHFTKENKIASLIAAIFYVLFPYRIMDAFTRMAMAEVIAFTWMPLFFMGLYDITHLDKEKGNHLIAFIEVVLGASLLFLSHNLTAFYVYIFGLIFILFNIKGLIGFFNNIKFWSYALVSIALIVSIASITLFPQIELLNSNMYGISDTNRMWTDIDHVTNRVDQFSAFSGFLNPTWIANEFYHSFTYNGLINSIWLFPLGALAFILIDYCLKRFKKMNVISFVLGLGVFFGIISISGARVEVYFAAIIFSLIYGCIRFYPFKENSFKIKSLFLDPNLYFLVLSLIILIIMMTCSWVWEILPQIFLNIQFPWRLWSLVQLFLSMLVGILIYYISKKKISAMALAVCACSLLVVNHSLVYRRGAYECYNYPEQMEIYEKIIKEDYDDSMLDDGVALGFNKEYIPLVLLDKEYESEYPNSLHDEISAKIPYNFYKYEDYSIKPVFLTGDAEIEVINALSPKYEMKIVVREDALIQMPLIYYEGYEVKFITSENDKAQNTLVKNVDGLIAFNLEKGTYKVNVDFKGNALRNSAKVISSFGLIIVILGLISTTVYSYSLKKKIRKNEE